MPVTHHGVTYRVADVHAHIYPAKIAEKASESIAEFYDVPMRHIGTPHTLVERGTLAGIDRFVVSSVATKVTQVHSINEFIAEKCRKYPQFIGLAAWHPELTDLERELDDIERKGLRGIKLHPDFQQFYLDDAKMLPLYRAANERKLPILFHMGDYRTDFSSANRLMNVLDKLPDFTCIAAHLGGYTEWETARAELSGTNVYVDTSSSLATLTREQALQSISHFGVNRTLFGTDFPMWEPKEELELFFALGLSEEENRLILYDNFAHLFGACDG